jgi:hypothetical protein
VACGHFGPEDSRNGWSLPGPWFEAMFDGGDCPRCDQRIMEGERIRANGEGSYEHEECVIEDGDEDPGEPEFDPFEGI